MYELSLSSAAFARKLRQQNLRLKIHKFCILALEISEYN